MRIKRFYVNVPTFSRFQLSSDDVIAHVCVGPERKHRRKFFLLLRDKVLYLKNKNT